MNRRASYVAFLFVGGIAITALGLVEFMRTGDMKWVVVTAVGFATLMAAGLFLDTLGRERPPVKLEDRAHVDVDWSLSDVCLQVTCPCSSSIIRHLHGYTFGRFRCPDCKKSYRIVPTTLPAYRTESSRSDRELRPVK